MYQDPLLKVGTVLREDCAAIVEAVYKKCVVQDGCRAVLLAGDFQRFCHLVRWNKLHPSESWMCPVPGEWHW